MDAWGNRAELCRDANLDCFEPMPIRPRRKPMTIASIAAKSQAVASGSPVVGAHTRGTSTAAGAASVNEKGTASLFVQNVYRGMTGIERGRVKFIRVMGALESPWKEKGLNNVGVDVHRKKVYGVVKVHEDGSAHFTVPAGENLFFQALDENFMALQQMPTFVNLMPGEKRSCIGCHELRREAPSMAGPPSMATEHPPQAIMPQPGDTGPRMVHYPTDVQPVLDKHCVGCHSGESPKGNLDLAGSTLNRKYNSSFDNLINSRLVNYRACDYGAAHFRALPPLTHGSHRSKLPAQISKDPCRSNLTREEFIRIVTWIDANVPYHGFYEKIFL